MVPDTSSPPDAAGFAALPGPAGSGQDGEDLDTVETADLSRLPEAAWVLLWLVGLVIIVTTPRWETVSCYLIWISFALLYGLRVWPSRLAADAARSAVSAENERLLAAQRRFLQDASHQLKTPITIALGHAELLARDLASHDASRDIHVVVGELNRLKSLSERLLLIAASENPNFLRPEPLALQSFAMELLFRWRPAAPRRWRIGRLDDAVVAADPERLALAVDALLENAVQHTNENDVIRLSVVIGERARFASVIIEDSGDGIPAADLTRIFDRFATARGAGGPRGTGLGLALAQAVARGHGGEIRVRSAAGDGSSFEFLLPTLAAAADSGAAAATSQSSAVPGESSAAGSAGLPAGSAGLPAIPPGGGIAW